jgi:hypothetical protein
MDFPLLCTGQALMATHPEGIKSKVKVKIYLSLWASMRSQGKIKSKKVHMEEA